MKKILVIDDTELIVEAIKVCLEVFGFEVVTAADAFEGLEALSEDIDLIILDLAMPGMCGEEFYAKLREMSEYDHIPVVILSGCAVKPVIPNVDVVTKPINVDILLKMVNTHIKKPIEEALAA